MIDKLPAWARKIWNILLYIGGAAIFIFMVEDLGLFKSIVLYSIFFLSMFLFKMYQWRDIIFYNIKQLETRQFGKPLDREKWERGELRDRKLKFVWRRPEIEK